MEEKARPDFHDFAGYLSTTPQVTEVILRQLEITDVVNCLRTCKSLRQAIKAAIKGRSKLKKHLDSEATRWVCTNGGWKTKLIPLNKKKIGKLFARLGKPGSVSLHGNWLFLCFYNAGGDFNSWFVLCFHNYATGETKTYYRGMAYTVKPGTMLMYGVGIVQKLAVPLDDSPMPQPQTLYSYTDQEVAFHLTVYESQYESLLYHLKRCHLRWLGVGQEEEGGRGRFAIELNGCSLVPFKGKAMEANPQKKMIRTLKSKVRMLQLKMYE